MEYIDRLLLGAPGERTFYRVKVPKLPGGRKRGKERVRAREGLADAEKISVYFPFGG